MTEVQVNTSNQEGQTSLRQIREGLPIIVVGDHHFYHGPHHFTDTLYMYTQLDTVWGESNATKYGTAN